MGFHLILLSGGSGKRLWPLSNDVRSKQFLKLFRAQDGGYESMVQRITFNADNDQALTKTVLDNDFSVLWTDADAITVFGSGKTGSRFDEIEVLEGGKSANFTGDAEASSSYYALSPAQDGAVIESGIISAEIPTEQTAREGSFGPDAGLAVAYCEGDRHFSFKQVGSLLGITIHNDGITAVSLYSGSPMTGAATISYNSGNPLSTITDGRQEVTLRGSFTNGKTYWLNVFPGTYKGLQIVYTRSDGKVASYTNPSMEIIIERAHAQRIADITVSDAKWQDPILAGAVRTTNSTITVAWTELASNASLFTHIWPKSVIASGYNFTEDIKHDYKVALYKDAACTNLWVEHSLPTSAKLFTAD